MVETNTHRRKRQEGFTLIELVVVVAILGVLAAVLTPRVLGAVDNAKANTATSTAKQLQVAFERYLAETGSYPADCAPATCTNAQYQDWLNTKLGGYAALNKSDFTSITYTVDNSVSPKTFSLTATLTSTGKNITVSQTGSSAS